MISFTLRDPAIIDNLQLVDRKMIIEVNSGSDSRFTVPTTAGSLTFSYNIQTSDGQSFTGLTANQEIIFPDANTNYLISIDGDYPDSYYPSTNISNRNKLLDIKQWGSMPRESMSSNFFDCLNMSVTATDSPNFIQSRLGYPASCYGSFRNTKNITEIDFSRSIKIVQRVDNMFMDSDIEKITMNCPSVTNTNNMLLNCTSLTDLLLFGLSVNIDISTTGLIGSKIDDFGLSVNDQSGITPRVITMSSVQKASCDENIWLDKNWSITTV